MPDAHQALGNSSLELEEPIALAVDGQFLYGAPAAGLKGEAEARIVRDMNPVPNAKGYSFGLLDEKFEEKIQRLEMPAAVDSGHVNVVDQLNHQTLETAAPLQGQRSRPVCSSRAEGS